MQEITNVDELEPLGPGCDYSNNNDGCRGFCLGGFNIDIDIKLPEIPLPW